MKTQLHAGLRLIILFLFLLAFKCTQVRAQVIDGPVSIYQGGVLGSCFYPHYDSATINVTIPGGMKVTNLLLLANYWTVPILPLSAGDIYFRTSCDTSPHYFCNFFVGGQCELAEGYSDSSLFSCFTPSCSDQTFWLTMYLSRTQGGSGCNSDYVYYQGIPTSLSPFKANVRGIRMAGAPLAQFSIAADTSQVHHYIVTDSSSGNNIVTYMWDWGDGNFDFTHYPSHTYADSGFYTICETVADVNGCTSTYCDSSFHALRTTNTMIYVNVVPDIPTGTKSFGGMEQLSIHPNPAANELIIHSAFSTNETATVFIMNVLGALMQQETQRWNSDMNINIEGLSPGLYFLQLKTENGMVEKRFVKE